MAIAGIAALYTSMGGLKSVAVTDVIQSFIMVAGAMVLFYVVWEKAGGFAGVEATLGETDPKTAHAMLHIGVDRALGYGLKYPTAFADTHLGRVGRG